MVADTGAGDYTTWLQYDEELHSKLFKGPPDGG
jgi:hypothetical protein